MGWDGISSRGSPLLHDCEWPLVFWGRLDSRPAGCVPEHRVVWLHVYMELVLSGWKDAFQLDGQFRRAITGAGCGMA
jgi:hypothetical protein